MFYLPCCSTSLIDPTFKTRGEDGEIVLRKDDGRAGGRAAVGVAVRAEVRVGGCAAVGTRPELVDDHLSSVLLQNDPL